MRNTVMCMCYCFHMLNTVHVYVLLDHRLVGTKREHEEKNVKSKPPSHSDTSRRSRRSYLTCYLGSTTDTPLHLRECISLPLCAGATQQRVALASPVSDGRKILFLNVVSPPPSVSLAIYLRPRLPEPEAAKKTQAMETAPRRKTAVMMLVRGMKGR